MPSLGWRWLLALSSLPTSLLLVFYVLTPESPRYLCLQGRRDEALVILKKIAKLNQTKLPPGILVLDQQIELQETSSEAEDKHLLTPKTMESASNDESSKMEKKTESSVLTLLSPELLRSTLLLWVVFFGNAFSYYGLVLLTTELHSEHSTCKQTQLKSNDSQDVNYRDVFITSFAGIILFN